MDIKLIDRTLAARGLSKSGLAKALRVSNSAISDLLRGGRKLSADEVPKVKKYLRLDTVPLKGFVSAGRATFFPGILYFPYPFAKPIERLRFAT